jgi:hypothetical protein
MILRKEKKMKKIPVALIVFLLFHITFFTSAWSAKKDSVLNFVPSILIEKEPPPPPPPVDDGRQDCTGLSPVVLNAFTDFSCGPQWTNRDGALGLRAGSGSGTCQASFPGNSGSYLIQVRVQAERDGAPHYRVSLNGNVIRDDYYPYSCGSLMCNSSIIECPDSNKDLNMGVFTVQQGTVISFYGAETYPCGEHGAYAKWHQIMLTPANCR